MSRSQILAPLLLLLLPVACQRLESPPGPEVLPPRTFALVHGELLQLGLERTSLPADSARRRSEVDSVLNHLGVTREQFIASVAWYNQDLRRWKTVLDSCAAVLQEKSKN
jgi:hypothetical protein